MFILTKSLMLSPQEKKINPFFGLSYTYFIVECCLDLNRIAGEEGPPRTLSITPHEFLEREPPKFILFTREV